MKHLKLLFLFGMGLMSFGLSSKALAINCLVTGSSSGIGQATALLLHQKGCRVFFAARSKHHNRIESLIQQNSQEGSPKSEFVELDLMSLKSVDDLVLMFEQQGIQIDVLINNAGVWQKKKSLSRDGFESTFQTNYLSHFLLTLSLAERSILSPHPTIINVASERLDTFDLKKELEDVVSEKPWHGLLPGDHAYAKTKTMTIMFNERLSIWLRPYGFSDCIAFHPGGVNTGIYANLPFGIGNLVKRFMKTPEAVAEELYSLISEEKHQKATRGPRLLNTTPKHAVAHFIQQPENQVALWNETLMLLHNQGYLQKTPVPDWKFLEQPFHSETIQNCSNTSICCNGLSERHLEAHPKTTHDLIRIVTEFEKTRSNNNGSSLEKIIVNSGNYVNSNGTAQGLSLDRQAQGYYRDLYILTDQLKTRKLEPGDYKWKPESRTLLLTVYSGTSFQEVLQLAQTTLKDTEKDHYEFLFPSAPTSDEISIGGALAAGTHSRTTSIEGNYLIHSVKGFELVTTIAGKTQAIWVDRKSHPDLFYAVPGSFGRGGIVSRVQLKLRRISTDVRAKTLVSRVDSKTLFEYFFQENLKSNTDGHDAFRSLSGILMGEQLFLLSSASAQRNQVSHLPEFPGFKKPCLFTSISQKLAHNLPGFSGGIASSVIAPGGQQEYANAPYSWVFCQNAYVNFMRHNPHQKTVQHAYAVSLSDLPTFLADLQNSLSALKAKQIAPKLADFVLMRPNWMLMSPFYKRGSISDGGVLVTLSWPIPQPEAQIEIEQERDWLLTRNTNVRVHPLKGFSGQEERITTDYRAQAQSVENILRNHFIDDSSFWNQVHIPLYERNRLK